MAPRTLVIGDSLGVGTLPHLRRLLQGQIDADVKGGRSSADGVNALARRRGRYDRILLDLGTNDSSAAQTRESVRRARRLAPDAEIVVATVHGPDAARKNRTLRNLQGVTVADWAQQSGGLLAGDGIHATAGGYEQRARLLARALRDGAAGGASREPVAAPAAPSPDAGVDPQALLGLLTRPPRQSVGLAAPQFAAQGPQAMSPLDDALRRVVTKWR